MRPGMWVDLLLDCRSQNCALPHHCVCVCVHIRRCISLFVFLCLSVYICKTKRERESKDAFSHDMPPGPGFSMPENFKICHYLKGNNEKGKT